VVLYYYLKATANLLEIEVDSQASQKKSTMLISEGNTIKSIYAFSHMPSIQTIFDWEIKNGEFSQLSAGARGATTPRLTTRLSLHRFNPCAREGRDIIGRGVRIAPDQDTGMDLNEPWITALGLFNAGKHFQ
jgi:hypothetical protein